MCQKCASENEAACVYLSLQTTCSKLQEINTDYTGEGPWLIIRGDNSYKPVIFVSCQEFLVRT